MLNCFVIEEIVLKFPIGNLMVGHAYINLITTIAVMTVHYFHVLSLIEGGSRTLKAIGRQVYSRAYEDLVDFDNHLDCVELDWTNPEINRALADIDTSTADAE